MNQFTLPEDRNIFTPYMESHQKNAGGNGKILFGISENYLYPKDFDSLLYASQILQAEAMRYGVEHWRRNRGDCMESVYWQLNECWTSSLTNQMEESIRLGLAGHIRLD